MVKKYKYDSPFGGDDGQPVDEGATCYVKDTRVVEWAEGLLRDCKKIREAATKCDDDDDEKPLLCIHAQGLEDQVVNKGVMRKLEHSKAKLEAYSKLELAVECAKESLRQAEAKVANHAAGLTQLCVYAATARRISEQTDKDYTEISGRFQVEVKLLMQRQRDAASARREAKRRRLMTSQVQSMCFWY